MEFITPLYYFDLKLMYREGPIVFWNHFNLFNTTILKDLIIGHTKFLILGKCRPHAWNTWLFQSVLCNCFPHNLWSLYDYPIQNQSEDIMSSKWSHKPPDFVNACA